MSFAVYPKTDCPHVHEAMHFDPTFTDEQYSIHQPCHVCGDRSENWMSLAAGHRVGCSRYVSGHMLEYVEQTDHCLAVSFADLSVWCYKCDSYITHPLLSDLLRKLHYSKFGEYPAGDESATPDANQPAPSGSSGAVQPQLTLEDIAKLIKDRTVKNIIVLSGAGQSTAAGIPDFRSPGSGLYDNLQKYNLPYPTAIFELEYFQTNPAPFFELAKSLLVAGYKPTPAHYFIRLLNENGLLLRNFTQNIDNLEIEAGLPQEKIVAAHGTYATAHCTNPDCKKEFTHKYVRDALAAPVADTLTVESESVETATHTSSSVDANSGVETESQTTITTQTETKATVNIPRCDVCNGVVKPDIVFFGESLPDRFATLCQTDFAECDLLIVIGTSLTVYPFALLPTFINENVPRVLINRDRGGVFAKNPRPTDVFVGGDIQDSIKTLANLVGWTEQLNDLIKSEAELGKSE